MSGRRRLAAHLIEKVLAGNKNRRVQARLDRPGGIDHTIGFAYSGAETEQEVLSQLLTETQFVEKLRGEPGRYVCHDMGTYTLREADGSVILEVPKQFVDDLTGAAKLVQYVDRDPRKLFPVPAFG